MQFRTKDLKVFDEKVYYSKYDVLLILILSKHS